MKIENIVRRTVAKTDKVHRNSRIRRRRLVPIARAILIRHHVCMYATVMHTYIYAAGPDVHYTYGSHPYRANSRRCRWAVGHVGGPIASWLSRFPEWPPASLLRKKRLIPSAIHQRHVVNRLHGKPREALSLAYTARSESSCRLRVPSPRTNWNVRSRIATRCSMKITLIFRASLVCLVTSPRDVRPQAIQRQSRCGRGDSSGPRLRSWFLIVFVG